MSKFLEFMSKFSGVRVHPTHDLASEYLENVTLAQTPSAANMHSCVRAKWNMF